MDKGLQQIADKKSMRFTRNRQTEVIANREGKMFVVKFEVIQSKKETQVVANDNFANVAVTEDLHTWHERLAHQNLRKVKNFLKLRNVKIHDKNETVCESCIKGKIHRQPFKKGHGIDSRTTEPGELIHADLCGPIQEPSIGGSRYMLLFKDDYSYFVTAYFIAHKNEVSDRLKNFLKKTENIIGRKIKTLRTDNGLEFVNCHVKEIISEHSIQHQRTVAYTPEQNGSAERENRTVMEAVRSMLHERNAPKELWAEAANTAIYVINRTEREDTQKAPFELWHEKKTVFEKPITFGAKAYVHISKIHRKKLDSKVKIGIFVGYGEDVKGFRIWYPETNKIEHARDVIFDERRIFSDNKRESSQMEQQFELVNNENKKEKDEQQDVQQEIQAIQRQPEEERPIEERFEEERFEEDTYSDTYSEAICSPDVKKWKKAMDEEIASLKENRTWTLVDYPDNKKVIKNR